MAAFTGSSIPQVWPSAGKLAEDQTRTIPDVSAPLVHVQIKWAHVRERPGTMGAGFGGVGAGAAVSVEHSTENWTKASLGKPGKRIVPAGPADYGA